MHAKLTLEKYRFFPIPRRFEPAERVAEAQFLDTASTALQNALQSLDARSRDIIEARWLAGDDDKATLQELGDRYGISAERVRQIEAAAIKRLRDALVTVEQPVTRQGN